MLTREEAIAGLRDYALGKNRIAPCEKTWAENTILEALGLSGWTPPP